MRPGPTPLTGCARPALCRRCVDSPRSRGEVVLLLENNHCSAGRVREARPGSELPLRAGRGGEEERSGEGPRIRCGAVQEASKDADSCAPAGGTWKRGRCRALVVVVDRTGMVHNNLELRERGGPSSQSTSAFRRRPPGKRQAVKPSGRRPPLTTRVLVSIAPDLQVIYAQATWCGRRAGRGSLAVAECEAIRPAHHPPLTTTM